MIGPITVVAHEISVEDVIGTGSGWTSLVSISLLIKTHVDEVTRKMHDISGVLYLQSTSQDLEILLGYI